MMRTIWMLRRNTTMSEGTYLSRMAYIMHRVYDGHPAGAWLYVLR